MYKFGRHLRAEIYEFFSGKCAYCGSRLGLTDAGRIDNFYPRSKYPEKADSVENLLLACHFCDASKADRFPLDDQGNPLLST